MSIGTSLMVTRLEAEHLADLVGQFAELVESADETDPAVERLSPDAYPDDAEANADFRNAARGDLLSRRAADAAVVLAALRSPNHAAPSGTRDLDDEVIEIRLGAEAVGAWLRTLAAIRLVLASRLGIVTEEDQAPDDPRYAVYDWIGYRLEALIQATDPADQGSSNT